MRAARRGTHQRRSDDGLCAGGPRSGWCGWAMGLAGTRPNGPGQRFVGRLVVRAAASPGSRAGVHHRGVRRPGRPARPRPAAPKPRLWHTAGVRRRAANPGYGTSPGLWPLLWHITGVGPGPCYPSYVPSPGCGSCGVRAGRRGGHRPVLAQPLRVGRGGGGVPQRPRADAGPGPWPRVRARACSQERTGSTSRQQRGTQAVVRTAGGTTALDPACRQDTMPGS